MFGFSFCGNPRGWRRPFFCTALNEHRSGHGLRTDCGTSLVVMLATEDERWLESSVDRQSHGRVVGNPCSEASLCSVYLLLWLVRSTLGPWGAVRRTGLDQRVRMVLGYRPQVHDMAAHMAAEPPATCVTSEGRWVCRGPIAFSLAHANCKTVRYGCAMCIVHSVKRVWKPGVGEFRR